MWTGQEYYDLRQKITNYDWAHDNEFDIDIPFDWGTF